MTWRPEPQPACPCGQPIPIGGPSLDYCSHACQYRHMNKGFDLNCLPARPEWREPTSESDWQRSLNWPNVPALPPEGVGEWIERTDPAPAEPPEIVKPVEPIRRILNATNRKATT